MNSNAAMETMYRDAPYGLDSADVHGQGDESDPDEQCGRHKGTAHPPSAAIEEERGDATATGPTPAAPRPAA